MKNKGDKTAPGGTPILVAKSLPLASSFTSMETMAFKTFKYRQNSQRMIDSTSRKSTDKVICERCDNIPR